METREAIIINAQAMPNREMRERFLFRNTLRTAMIPASVNRAANAGSRSNGDCLASGGAAGRRACAGVSSHSLLAHSQPSPPQNMVDMAAPMNK